MLRSAEIIYILYKYHSLPNGLIYRCPWCKVSGALRINLPEETFSCRYCKKKGDLDTLIEYLAGVDSPEFRRMKKLMEEKPRYRRDTH